MSRMQIKESDSSVCHETQVSVGRRETLKGRGQRVGHETYAGVECDGGLVDAQATELK